MNPFFSVIIPTFNRASTILRAITSVMKQDYKSFELIVIDDASTDNTLSLLENKNLILLKNQKNSGVSASRNLAAKKAQGEYLAFLDSDDEWLPSKLQKQFEVIKEKKTKLVHTEEIWMRNGVRVNQMKKHQKAGGDQFKRSCELCILSPSSVAIERETFFELGGFREDFVVCEDYDLWLKYTSLYPCEYIEVPQIIKYGGHSDQLSRKLVAMDYYRIKSLDFILDNRELSDEKFDFARKILLTKSRNLIKGYLKHQNLENFPEIERIQKKWSDTQN